MDLRRFHIFTPSHLNRLPDLRQLSLIVSALLMMFGATYAVAHNHDDHEHDAHEQDVHAHSVFEHQDDVDSDQDHEGKFESECFVCTIIALNGAKAPLDNAFLFNTEIALNSNLPPQADHRADPAQTSLNAARAPPLLTPDT